jgi:hypothetical protein
MDKIKLEYSEKDIQDSIKNKQEQDQPAVKTKGEVNGFRFALDNHNSPKDVFDEYLRAQKKMKFWYSLDMSPIGLIPFIGYKTRGRAWFWDGYQMSLSRVLGVYCHTDSTGNETVKKIIKNESEEVIYEERN